MVAEAGIYFPSGGSALDDAGKADLDTLAAATKGLEGYLIEIAGYASTTGTKQLNQKLSGSPVQISVVVSFIAYCIKKLMGTVT